MSALSGTARRAAARLLSSLPALLGVLVFTFLLMRVLPGDPAVFFASGPNAGKEEIEEILAVFERLHTVDSGRLGPAHAALEGRYDFGVLKCLLAEAA